MTRQKDSKVKLVMTVAAAELARFFEQTLKELQKDFSKSGFRKGKAPLALVEQELGERVSAAALEKAINSSYQQALREHELTALAEPEVKITKQPRNKNDKDSALVFELQVEVWPQLTLPDYKQLAKAVKRQPVKVEAKALDNTLAQLRQSRTKQRQVLRAARLGDYVELTFSSPQLENNKPFEDKFVLGQGQLVPGFEQQVVGLETGQRRKFKLSIPQDYLRKDLAGRDLEFDVQLNQVQELELPALDDEFAKSLGRFQTLDELKRSINEGLLLEARLKESQRVQSALLAAIAAKISVALPPTLIKREQERQLNETKAQLQQQFNLPFEQYLKQINKSADEFNNSLNESAEKQVKKFFILRQLAKAENIVTTEQEVAERAKPYLQHYKTTARASKDFSPEKLNVYLREQLFNEKTLAALDNLVNNGGVIN